MRHDVISLACGDWCIQAASPALVGGGGVGMGVRGGGWVNFSTDRDVQMWSEPSMGSVQSPGQYGSHTCNTAAISACCSTVGQFWCCKRVHEQRISVKVLLTLVRIETHRVLGGVRGGRPGSDYGRQLHLPSEFCYISRLREEWTGDGRGYGEWKNKCFTDRRGDTLRWSRQGVLEHFCQLANLVLLL